MLSRETTTSSDIWQSLGTFWSQLPSEDKELIETIWDGYLEAFSSMYDELDNIVSSTSISSMPGYLTSSNEYFDIIYSGTETYSGLVNTELIDGAYNYYFKDNRIIIAISGMESEYYDSTGLNWSSSGMSVDEDYTISDDGERITFLKNPPIQRNLYNDYFYQGDIYAGQVTYLNPALFNIYGALVRADRKLFVDRSYTDYKDDYLSSGDELRGLANHFKYMVWGLRYFKQSRPTLNNFKKGLSIARGLPFAYMDGTIESITTSATRSLVNMDDGTTYYVPIDLDLSFSSGESVYRFDPLVSGIDLYDWVNGSGIMYDMDIFGAQHKGTLLYSLDQTITSGLIQYDQEFFDVYTSGILPASMMFAEVERDDDNYIYLG